MYKFLTYLLIDLRKDISYKVELGEKILQLMVFALLLIIAMNKFHHRQSSSVAYLNYRPGIAITESKKNEFGNDPSILLKATLKSDNNGSLT